MALHIVDAFTDRPFAGNPAAVCLLDGPAEVEWMQAVAGEMNLSETAFVHPSSEGTFALRWFTPTVEVDLCGHATLASAHVLFEAERLAAGDEARFDTRSGRLTVRRSGEAALTMDFPATPPGEGALPNGFVETFGFEPTWTGRSRFDLFAVAPDEQTVRALDPDPAAVAALGSRGVIVTAPGAAGTDIDAVSRFFAPGVGVVEDPVTGSAHCAIGPYWAGRLGRDRIRCYQASRRGGHLEVTVVGDRVHLGGSAVTILRGELTAAAHSLH